MRRGVALWVELLGRYTKIQRPNRAVAGPASPALDAEKARMHLQIGYIPPYETPDGVVATWSRRERIITDDRVVVLGTKRLLDDFFKVDEATLRYRKFSGQLSEEMRRLSVERGNSAGVILYDRSTDEIILIEQFKWPTYANDGGWIVETVAGVVDPDEDPAQTAVREAFEETGYEIGLPEFICRYYATPGGSSEQIYLYAADVSGTIPSHEKGGLIEEGEDIRLRRFSLAAAVAAISDGEIIDAKAIIGINWIRQKRLPNG